MLLAIINLVIASNDTTAEPPQCTGCSETSELTLNQILITLCLLLACILVLLVYYVKHRYENNLYSTKSSESLITPRMFSLSRSGSINQIAPSSSLITANEISSAWDIPLDSARDIIK